MKFPTDVPFMTTHPLTLACHTWRSHERQRAPEDVIAAALEEVGKAVDDYEQALSDPTAKGAGATDAIVFLADDGRTAKKQEIEGPSWDALLTAVRAWRAKVREDKSQDEIKAALAQLRTAYDEYDIVHSSLVVKAMRTSREV